MIHHTKGGRDHPPGKTALSSYKQPQQCRWKLFNACAKSATQASNWSLLLHGSVAHITNVHHSDSVHDVT